MSSGQTRPDRGGAVLHCRVRQERRFDSVGRPAERSQRGFVDLARRRGGSEKPASTSTTSARTADVSTNTKTNQPK